MTTRLGDPDAEPGGANFEYRRANPDELINPFENTSKTTGVLTMKYCAWEVLRDYPAGLTVKLVVDEIEARALRVFTGKANPTGQVSGDMSRDTDNFFHYKNSNIWTITPFVPRDLLAQGSSHDRRRHRAPRNEANVGSGKKKKKKKRGGAGSSTTRSTGGGAGPPSSPDGSAPTGPPSPSKPDSKLAKHDLMGYRCLIWWDGTQQFYGGRLTGYDSEDDTYEVEYDDGETDYQLRLLEYDVKNASGRKPVVVITRSREELTGRGIESDNGSGREASAGRRRPGRKRRASVASRPAAPPPRGRQLSHNSLLLAAAARSEPLAGEQWPRRGGRQNAGDADEAEDEDRGAATGSGWGGKASVGQRRRARDAEAVAYDERPPKQPRTHPEQQLPSEELPPHELQERLSSLLSLGSLSRLSSLTLPLPQMAGAQLAASLNCMGPEGATESQLLGMLGSMPAPAPRQRTDVPPSTAALAAAAMAAELGLLGPPGNFRPGPDQQPQQRQFQQQQQQQLGWQAQPFDPSNYSPFLHAAPEALLAMAAAGNPGRLGLAVAASGSRGPSGEKGSGEGRRRLERVPTEEVLCMSGSELLQLGGLDSLPSLNFSAALQSTMGGGSSGDAAGGGGGGDGGGRDNAEQGSVNPQKPGGGSMSKDTPFKLWSPPPEMPDQEQQRQRTDEERTDEAVLLIDRPAPLQGGPSWKLPRQLSGKASETTGFVPGDRDEGLQRGHGLHRSARRGMGRQ